MKLTFLISLQFLFFIALKAQVNLVPNPDLEDTVFCPTTISQPQAANHWSNFGNTPEYFNACNQNGLGVPNSGLGFQYAHSGVGMLGLVTYRNPAQPSGPNYREYVGTKLTSPLLIGQKYFLSFYVNFAATNFTSVPTNNLGMKFSAVLFDSAYPPPLNNYCHLNENSIISDSINWIRVSGSITADSAYEYIMLGNFFDDLNTDTIKPDIFSDVGYYFFDDICISTDSIYNETWTGIAKPIDSNPFKIFPNPVKDVTNINYTYNQKLIGSIFLIYNTLGKIVFSFVLDGSSNNYSINLSGLQSGIYIVKINNYPTTTRLIKL